MDIEQISERKLLITLSSEDMADFKVSFESMSVKSQQERRVIMRLLQLSFAKAGVSYIGKTVLVEALPFLGGCALFVTLFDKEKKPKTYRVKEYKRYPAVRFSDAEALLSTAESLKGKRMHRNSLWLFEGEYYLVMDYPAISREVSLVLSQYGRIIKLTSVALSRIRESGKALCKDDAMRLIGERL